MKQATIQLETLTCPSCLQKITNALTKLPGTDKESVKVMFNSSKVKLNFNESNVTISEIEKAITTLGFEVIKSQVKDL